MNLDGNIMDTHVDKIEQDSSQLLTGSESQMETAGGGKFQVVDNSREAKEAIELESMADNSPEGMKLKAFQYMVDNSPEAKETAELQNKANNSPEGIELSAFQDIINSRPEIMELKDFQDRADNYVINEEAFVQKKENKTGLPNDLKYGIEALSGQSMDDVKVHYNSNEPSDLQAHAYTDGTEIHLGPGQKKHLPHEAWHVVQQKKGKVSATNKINGQPLNDDQNLEKEADQKGKEAERFSEKDGLETPTKNSLFNTSIQNANSGAFQLKKLPCGHESNGVIQRMVDKRPNKEMTSEELLEYVYGTFINNRFQTFQQAVEDAIGNNNYSIKEMFFALETYIEKGETLSAISQIERIIDAINEHEAKSPNHPNPVWNGKKGMNRGVEHESPFTIAKTPESKTIAKDMQRLVLSENNLNVGNKHQGIKAEQCMLGVLVLPSGELIVGLSGAGKNFVKKIEKILLKGKKKYPLLGNKIYTTEDIDDDDKDSYEATVTDKLETKDKFEKDENSKKIVRRRKNKEDQGSYAANCAASVVLSVAKHKGQNKFKGEGKLGLTEVWLSPNSRSKVIIYNQETGHGHNFNRNNDDVPSCHVCQMQLDEVAREVVLMERNNVFENLNNQLCQVEDENREALKVANKLEEDILDIELSKEQKEELKKLVDKEKELQSNLDEIQKKLSAKENSLVEFNKKVESLKEDINQTKKELKKDKGNLNQTKNKHDKIEARLRNEEEQEKTAEKIKKLSDELEILKEAQNELGNSKEVSGWFYTSYGAKSVEKVQEEIQIKHEEDEENGELFNEYKKGKKGKKGKRKSKNAGEFATFVDDQIKTKQDELDELNGEEGRCLELENEVTILEKRIAKNNGIKEKKSNELQGQEEKKTSRSKDVDGLKKEEKEEEGKLRDIKKEIDKIKLETSNDSNFNTEYHINKKLQDKKTKKRNLLKEITANQFKIKHLKMSIKKTEMALGEIKQYGKEINSLDSDESIEIKSKDDSSSSNEETAKKKKGKLTKEEEIKLRRERLEVLTGQIQKSKSKIRVQESEESEESKEPYKDEVEEEIDLQNVPLWYYDDNGDVALNPNSLPLFRTAYLNDVVESRAYLTEAEGHVLATDLGISLNVIEGAIDLNEYHVITNSGRGDCLIHTLVAAEFILDNDNDSFIEEFDANNTEGYRAVIANNMTNEQLEPIIVAAMFGNEPGMGGTMRNLVRLADLTRSDFPNKEKPKKKSPEKKSIKKKGKKEGQEQEVVQLPHLGNGTPSETLFAHHHGLHWQLIVKKAPKKKN